MTKESMGNYVGYFTQFPLLREKALYKEKSCLRAPLTYKKTIADSLFSSIQWKEQGQKTSEGAEEH